MAIPDPAGVIDWVERPGSRIGMTDLATGLRLRPEDGVDMLVLLVEDTELERAQAPVPPDLDLIRYPIPDRGVPPDRATFADLLAAIGERLAGGLAVVIACHGGLGRTGTVAACVFIAAGQTPAEAIQLVRATRPGTIETDPQLAFVKDLRPT